MLRILLLLLLPVLLFACSEYRAADEAPLVTGTALVMWYTDN